MVGFTFIVKGMSVTPRPVLWSWIVFEVEGPSWSGAVCHSIIGLSLLSVQAISTLCVTGKTSSSLIIAACPRNVLELAGALVEEWGNISQQELANLVQSMRRCTAVLNAAVGHARQ